jgi:transposase-like protein
MQNTKSGTMSSNNPRIRHHPPLFCPHCIEDRRLVRLDFILPMLQYRCSICTFRLNDEDVYRSMNASKL